MSVISREISVIAYGFSRGVNYSSGIHTGLGIFLNFLGILLGFSWDFWGFFSGEVYG